MKYIKQKHPHMAIATTKLLTKAMRWQKLIILLGIALAVMIYILFKQHDSTMNTENHPEPIYNPPLNLTVSPDTSHIRPPLKGPVQAPAKIPYKPPAWQTVKVRPGDSLATIFADLGLNAKTLADIRSLKKGVWQKLHPGQQISFKIDNTKELQGMEIKLNPRENLIIKKVGQRYQAFLEKVIPKKKYRFIRTTIHNSLYQTAKRATISDKIILQLIEIFNWDIDFTRDIHSGDNVEILYETFEVDNEPAGVGDLLYIKIKTRGKIHEAIRYTDPKGHTGYYTKDGKSLRKAFLRTPVKYSHISSYFNLERFHPILHKIRAHKGVDYAAPRGTPVKSAGDGIITFTGNKSGYGHTVIVKHTKVYETLYAHLDHFATNTHPGKNVSQGDIIGYVGSSGLATGPHLHYEFHINGIHHNPLSTKLPMSFPIEKKYLADFKRSTQRILAELK
jgi:murein DD-endopeptidase MepM/ murein hydrolase activator NlpD